MSALLPLFWPMFWTGAETGIAPLDWLLAPIDARRPHHLGPGLSWHGRLMVLAWGVLVPTGVIAARFFKVLPRQRFPEVVDSRVWWRTHLAAQIGAILVTLAGLALVLSSDRGVASTASLWTHRALGYCVLALGVAQGVSGAFRGSKGGPTDRRGPRGDHYDMTPRRRAFERFHKAAGYAALALSLAAVLTGLWQANGPRWMWITLVAWWALLAAMFLAFQRRGMVVDTYLAIWGPEAHHPGNRPRR